jgi:hypothetical protein
VNVQLVDAATGNHLWAERFDKPVADLFDLQDEIVSRLSCTLHSQLVLAEARRPERSLHPDAMEPIFQARACLYRRKNPPQLTQSPTIYERVLDHLSLCWDTNAVTR